MQRKKVLFYCASLPNIVLFKIGRALKKGGYSPVLFTMCERERLDYNFYSEAFDEIICSDFRFFKFKMSSLPYLLKRIYALARFSVMLKRSKPDVVIATFGNNWQFKLAREYFFPNCPFIYFPYDILSHCFKSKSDALKEGVKEFEINAERYCFENSEGIIHKGSPEELEVIEKRIHKGIKLPENILNFFPYCSKEFYPKKTKKKLSMGTKEFHVACPGFLPNNPEMLKKLGDIFSEFRRQNIHIHIYAITDHISKEEEEKYTKELSEAFMKNPNVHFHRQLGPKEIIEEMTIYDFGFLNSNDKNPDNLEPKFGNGNKISSFFEAEIPIICENSLEFMGEIIKGYNAGILFDLKTVKTINEEMNPKKYKQMIENVKRAKEDYDIDKNFPRLRDFIEKIISESKQK
jgi:hypothetical protein